MSGERVEDRMNDRSGVPLGSEHAEDGTTRIDVLMELGIHLGGDVGERHFTVSERVEAQKLAKRCALDAARDGPRRNARAGRLTVSGRRPGHTNPSS